MKLGVVADDLTGAGDLGGMTAKAGYATSVYPFDPSAAGSSFGDEVVVLDTDSRFDAPEVAYHKVFAATRALERGGCPRFFNKTCSVFRGNVGAEFDAMLDALGEDFAVVVLGFPKNGRLTRDGIHYVHGARLEDSPFRRDPVHPMRDSSLVRILQRQTRRRVGRLGYRAVARGAGALKEAIEAERAHTDYLILDVTSQGDLATIAAAVRGVRVLCGSSALAEELPAFWDAPAPRAARPRPARTGLGALCVVGSLTPQTEAQVAHLAALGLPSAVLDAAVLFDPAALERETRRLSAALLAALRAGQDALLRSASDAEAAARAQAEGAARGLEPAAVGRQVSAFLAEVVRRCRREAPLNRLLVAGGDTSAAICRGLGVRRLCVGAELAPGIPLLQAGTGPAPAGDLLLVLKSGSFGGPAFLAQALAHLREAHEPA